VTKGYKVHICPVCKVKRHVRVTGVVHKTELLFERERNRPYRTWRCSKGHLWDVVIGTTELMSDALKAIYIKPMREMMEQPSFLYTRLKHV
jgi:hypothetical protein